MKIQKAGDCPYIVVDNFLDDYELIECWKTVDSLKISGLAGPDVTGSALNLKTMQPVKKNRGVWLTEIYDKYPGLCPLIEVFIPKHADVRTQLIEKHPAFRCLSQITYSMLLSYYGNDDRYEDHRDNSQVTTLFWLCKEEQRFTGGDLILEGTETVEFKNNRLIMFPGYTHHEVTPVTMNPHYDALGLGRWTLTMFSDPQQL